MLTGCVTSGIKSFLMDHPEYRKLRMHLPRQPLARQRPWLIAGFVLVLIIVLIAAYGYMSDEKRSEGTERQKKISGLYNM